ncbi:MAG: MarR family transcriptional regulator [Planctomycetes bacterium]|nr:MarR family transcriptional regulator [Planctomycetota bacterium]
MLDHDFKESLGYWTCQTAHALEKAMNEELAAHGITYQQWQVLAWLSLAGGEMTQGDLIERLKIEPPTLAGILERMERSGWVVRETDPEDRRKKIVRPTPAVEPVWKRMVTCAKQVRARAFRGLDEATVRQTREVLATVLENLSSDAARREKSA